MEEIKEKKQSIREEIAAKMNAFPASEIQKKNTMIADRLFDFANFRESKIPLLYVNTDLEVDTTGILEKCMETKKVIVLPAFDIEKKEMTFFKVDDLQADLKSGPRGVLEPDKDVCKMVPIKYVDIAIVPVVALDEKGGRIGTGRGYYDKLIPKLSNTTRKVALAYDFQVIDQIPMDTHDKYVDIIITEDRIIYKI